MTLESRIYPRACMSACCGRTECPDDCRDLPALLEFKAWVERTNAVQPDVIWSPSFYTATKSDPKRTLQSPHGV